MGRTFCKVVAFSMLALVFGCDRPVDRLVVAVKRPYDRLPDALYFAVDAVRTSGQGDAAAPALIELMKHDEPAIRAGATGALGSVRANPAIVLPNLLEVRLDSDALVRLVAIQSLGRIRPVDNRSISALADALSDQDKTVRCASAEALIGLGAAAQPAIPNLIQALDDKAVWGDAARALANLGPKAKKAVPALVEMAREARGYNRLYAAKALWRIDGNADITVSVLLGLLEGDYVPLRVDAAKALAELGPLAKGAAPLLLRIIAASPRMQDLPGPGVNLDQHRPRGATTTGVAGPRILSDLKSCCR